MIFMNKLLIGLMFVSIIAPFSVFAMTPAEFNTITNNPLTVCQLHGAIGTTYDANGILTSYTYTLNNCVVANNYTDYIRLSWRETGRQLVEKGYSVGRWTGDAATAITMWLAK